MFISQKSYELIDDSLTREGSFLTNLVEFQTRRAPLFREPNTPSSSRPCFDMFAAMNWQNIPTNVWRRYIRQYRRMFSREFHLTSVMRWSPRSLSASQYSNMFIHKELAVFSVYISIIYIHSFRATSKLLCISTGSPPLRSSLACEVFPVHEKIDSSKAWVFMSPTLAR